MEEGLFREKFDRSKQQLKLQLALNKRVLIKGMKLGLVLTGALAGILGLEYCVARRDFANTQKQELAEASEVYRDISKGTDFYFMNWNNDSQIDRVDVFPASCPGFPYEAKMRSYTSADKQFHQAIERASSGELRRVK